MDKYLVLRSEELPGLLGRVLPIHGPSTETHVALNFGGEFGEPITQWFRWEDVRKVEEREEI